jgi:predicted nucleic acid-binding protein
VRFWDSSGIVPLLVQESQSALVDRLMEEDAAIVSWWGTPIECMSALARQRRDGALDADGLQAATARLRRLATVWIEVPPGPHVREHASRLVRVHPLRAADATQLAAALVAADFRPDTLEFVTFDDPQAEAAEREGFRLVGR